MISKVVHPSPVGHKRDLEARLSERLLPVLGRLEDPSPGATKHARCTKAESGALRRAFNPIAVASGCWIRRAMEAALR